MTIKNIKVLLFFIIPSLLFISCNETTTKDEIVTEIEEVEKPVLKYGLEIENYNIESSKIGEGMTLSDILVPHGINYLQIDDLVKRSKEIFDVRKIKAGNEYLIFKTKDSIVKTEYFIYKLSAATYIRYQFSDSIIIVKDKLPIRIDTLFSEGTINSSLWMSMKNSGADPTLALYMSDIYAWTIDFFGLQDGDSYKVLYETKFVDSTYIGISKIISAQFNHFGNNYMAYTFVQDSIEDYFDELGGSLRRTFLKAPLKFSRISSRFSNSRYHPVLKIRRPHHGVDYAAPTGTPVMSIGDGIVTSAGRNGGYGKRVVIKHNGTYTTGYAHLSKYGAGIKSGVKVKQGDIIGYVGSTGLSTGPHLDFRFYKGGKAVDPLKVESPPALPIDSVNLKAYKQRMELLNELMK